MSNEKSNIFLISDRAKKAKAAGRDVIDGTVGMFLNEEGVLSRLPAVSDILKDFSSLDLQYSPVGGSQRYLDSALEWMLGEERAKKAKADNSVASFATLGGTEALYLAFRYAQTENFELLIPGIGWPNYQNIAKSAQIQYKPYSLFDEEGKFNIASIKKIIQKDKLKFRGFSIVVNDPCQNPTGYTMSDQEVEDLFKMVEAVSAREKTRIEIIFDAAYLDFSSKSPKWMDLMLLPRKMIKCELLFSASKSFGIYGLRAGAIYAFFNPEKSDKARNFLDMCQNEAYGIYSAPSSAGIYAVEKLLAPENRAKLKEEISVWKEQLQQRSEALLDSLEENEIPHFPYEEGFYLLVKTPTDPVAICEKLEKKDVYLAPVGLNTIRISIASLTLNQIPEIGPLLKEAFAG